MRGPGLPRRAGTWLKPSNFKPSGFLIPSISVAICNVASSAMSSAPNWMYPLAASAAPVNSGANAAEFGDGKIKVWREYFDQQFAVKLVQKGMESRKQGG